MCVCVCVCVIRCRSACLKLHEDSSNKLRERLTADKEQLEKQYITEINKLRYGSHDVQTILCEGGREGESACMYNNY